MKTKLERLKKIRDDAFKSYVDCVTAADRNPPYGSRSDDDAAIDAARATWTTAQRNCRDANKDSND